MPAQITTLGRPPRKHRRSRVPNTTPVPMAQDIGAPRVALAGGDGASTLLSHLTAEHLHGRGLLGFFDNAGARKSLARVCREFRREVVSFRWFRMVELRGHTAEVLCVCELDDGRVASLSKLRTVRLWNTFSGACERVFDIDGHDDEVECICALPPGRLVTGSRDSTLRPHAWWGHWVLQDGRIVTQTNRKITIWKNLIARSHLIHYPQNNDCCTCWGRCEGDCHSRYRLYPRRFETVCSLDNGDRFVAADNTYQSSRHPMFVCCI